MTRTAPVPSPAGAALAALVFAALAATVSPPTTSAEQPLAPCHPNPNAAADSAAVAARGDVAKLPQPLKDRLVRAGRPSALLSAHAGVRRGGRARAGCFSTICSTRTGFEPNVFTAQIPGVNDTALLTATGADCGLPTIGAVRLVVEPKPGLPTDPNDPGAFIDIFTDISPLFVINNESGWYEGWMIHDLVVPPVAPPRPDGHAQFGTLTQADADLLEAMGAGNNVPGQSLHHRRQLPPRFPSPSDHFPDRQTNVVPHPAEHGRLQRPAAERRALVLGVQLPTNWVHPLYELPFTGGFPARFRKAPDAFQKGEIGALQSLVPGSGPARRHQQAR